MSDITTIARPYAKAIFKHALAAKQLASWSVLLHELAEVVLNSHAQHFICNPSATEEQQVQLLLVVCAKDNHINEKKVVETIASDTGHLCPV